MIVSLPGTLIFALVRYDSILVLRGLTLFVTKNVQTINKIELSNYE